MNIAAHQVFWAMLLILAPLFAFACITEQPSKPGSKPQKVENVPASTSSDTSLPGGSDNTSVKQQEGDAASRLINRKWTGDLHGMIERRMIRVLTTYSKTNYFVDRGTQRGLTYEAFRTFEDDLNKKLSNKEIRVNVVFVPVANDDLIPALLEGRGDVVAAGNLITEWRRREKVGRGRSDPLGSRRRRIVGISRSLGLQLADAGMMLTTLVCSGDPTTATTPGFWNHSIFYDLG